MLDQRGESGTLWRAIGRLGQLAVDRAERHFHINGTRDPIARLRKIQRIFFGMQTAIGESTYPVLGSVKWRHTYVAAVSSPLRPRDLLHGHLLFTTLRLAMNCVAFMVVMAVFGAIESPWAVLALPAAVLTGLAFAAPIEAWAISLTKDSPFAYLFRFGLIPLFLFSGTFFPVSQLPVWVQPVAYATPLWHGVALCRSLTLGQIPVLESLGHTAYLIALALAGLYAGHRTYRRRLYV